VSKSLQITVDSLNQKMIIVEKERDEIKLKENQVREDLKKYERELQIVKENESERYEKEFENHLKSKTKLKEYESN